MSANDDHDAFPQTGIVAAEPGEKLNAMGNLVYI
jgi:hypothetical protein